MATALFVEATKWCASCQQSKPLASFARNRTKRDGYSSQCRDCKRITNRRWWLKNYFDLTPERYEEMLENQDGLCAICRRPPNGRGLFHVDHDHETDRVRGLLCMSCNTAIGHLNEDVELMKAIIQYLEPTA